MELGQNIQNLFVFYVVDSKINGIAQPLACRTIPFHKPNPKALRTQLRTARMPSPDV